MKLKLLSLLLLVSITAYSKEIYEKTARKVAKNFIANNGGDSSGCVFLKRDASFFYYNFNHGFVVVRKFDQLRPIARYSNEAQYSDCRESLAMMEVAHEKVQASKYLNIPPANDWSNIEQGRQMVRAGTKAVLPMVPYILNQDNGFWELMGICTPHHLNILTGCGPVVGVTLSLYWKYPTAGTGSFSYNDPEGGTRTCNFAAANYNYSSISTNPKGNAVVQQLMRDYGVAMQAQLGCYSVGGTGVFGIGRNYRTCEYAYINNFKFKSTMKGINQSTSPANFDAAIKADLDAARPVQLFIFTSDGAGHTVVLDGYDINGLVHCRMGWGGAGDSWYSLSGFTVQGYTFNTGFQALTGIEPSEPVTPPTPPIVPPVVPPTPAPTICNASTNLKVISLTSTTATVSWTSDATNTGWRVAYSPWSGGTVQFANATSPFTITGLAPNTKYSWYVNSLCGNLQKNSSSPSFTTLAGTVPPTPTCSVPTGLSAQSFPTSATITWQGLATDSFDFTFAGAITRVKGLTTTITGLTPSTAYSYSIKHICGSLNASTSGTFTTSALPCPNPVTLNAAVTTLLSWTPVSGALSYKLTYVINGASQTTTITNTNLTVSGAVSSFTVLPICQ